MSVTISVVACASPAGSPVTKKTPVALATQPECRPGASLSSWPCSGRKPKACLVCPRPQYDSVSLQTFPALLLPSFLTKGQVFVVCCLPYLPVSSKTSSITKPTGTFSLFQHLKLSFTPLRMSSEVSHP